MSATSYENFQWRETRPGLWSRDIDEVEMAYTSLQKQWAGSGRSFFHMTGHISLKVPVQANQDHQEAEHRVDTALSKAWIALRFHHPTIASRVELDHQARKYVKVYHISSDGWLDETLKLIDNGQTGIEWANNDPPAPLLPTLNIIKPPSDDKQWILRDLVLRSPHNIIDGIGTLLLFDNYIRLASEAFVQGTSFVPPSLDDHGVIENLSPPYRVAASIPPKPSAQILRRLEALAAQEKISSSVDIANLPFKRGALVPGVHKRVEIILSPEETSKLTTACKSSGATVTHVFHAAIALVVRDLQPKQGAPRHVQYVGYLLRNERPRCRPPYNDHRHAAATYHSVSGEKLVVDMTVSGETGASVAGSQLSKGDQTEFLRIVRQLRDFYFNVRDDAEHHLLAPMLWAKGTNPLPTDPEEEHVIPEVPPPAEAASATISSMGRIDNMIAHQHGPFEVYHPWVTGEELRSSLGLFLGTFRGQLSLSAAYNDAWHDENEVMGFVRGCLDVVNAGFGL